MLTITGTTPVSPDTPTGHGGSGGCSAGFAALALLAVPFVARGKKHRQSHLKNITRGAAAAQDGAFRFCCEQHEHAVCADARREVRDVFVFPGDITRGLMRFQFFGPARFHLHFRCLLLSSQFRRAGRSFRRTGWARLPYKPFIPILCHIFFLPAFRSSVSAL